MEKNDRFRVHDEFAAEYDQKVSEYKCYAAEILFGLCFEYVNLNDRLLDVGIGTGLGSLPFAKAGLEVYGVNGSMEMLKVCRKKNFTKELKHFDLQNLPVPYSDAFFNHVISCGVFHFFGDLGPIFSEVSRMIKPGGVFAFTIMAHVSEKEDENTSLNREDYAETLIEGVAVFMHSDRYIKKLFESYGFNELKMLKFIVCIAQEERDDLFCAYLAQRTSI